jgi:hypothetical protein
MKRRIAPRERAEAEPDDVGRDVVGDRVRTSERIAGERQAGQRDHHRREVDRDEAQPPTGQAHHLTVPEGPRAAAAVAHQHAEGVRDHEGAERLLVHRPGAADVAVDEPVEHHEGDEGRHTSDGQELRALGEEALPAVTHRAVA